MSVNEGPAANLMVPPELVDDTDDLHFVPAPCQVACPIGTDAPSYLAHIWEEMFAEAFEAITATNPFSSICGRVCDAPCEPACRRAAADGPIAIRNLKRFVMDKLGRDHHLPAVAVTRTETVAIVGAGPAGLTAAQDLAEAGYAVHVYEASDRLGGMMVWGIPAFRLPPGIIEEDTQRMLKHCPGIEVHLDTGLGTEVSLAELKSRHDAVLLTIGSWWGKSLAILGAEDPRVVDGVGFLRRVNAGERPEMPARVVVVGGGDVAMDACRVARRLPGCESVAVVYRRGAEDIPARRDELEGAIKEGVEFVYNTQQTAVVPHGNAIALRCVRTEPGEVDADGRRRPVAIAGSDHDIPCGMVIAAVGQQAESEELAGLGMMAGDRVHADFDTMRTEDPCVFAAGDGAFGGSTIVVAMEHGHRAAYYIKAFLEGVENPMLYRTPYRTRRVVVAQDLMWERFPRQEQTFHGLGAKPAEFPEIEDTYNLQTAKDEAARCYRCDAETGSADYSVQHREDIFAMARTNPLDHAAHGAMLHKRLRLRENPFPEDRPPSLEDLVFLPANLSRLVIDPYREACAVDATIGGRLALAAPFFVAGFDEAPETVRDAVAAGLAEAACGYLGARQLSADVPWLQLLDSGGEPSPAAAAIIGPLGVARCSTDQALGLVVASPAALEDAIGAALEAGVDMLVLDASGGLPSLNAEVADAPDLTLIRDAVAILRRLGREETIDLAYFGGVRSGTDTAKLMALGAAAVVLGLAAGIAAGGEITAGGLRFRPDYEPEDRAAGVANILKASASEASMMARCTGKTRLQNVEPEDLRALTLATAEATAIPLAGTG